MDGSAESAAHVCVLFVLSSCVRPVRPYGWVSCPHLFHPCLRPPVSLSLLMCARGDTAARCMRSRTSKGFVGFPLTECSHRYTHTHTCTLTIRTRSRPLSLSLSLSFFPLSLSLSLSPPSFELVGQLGLLVTPSRSSFVISRQLFRSVWPIARRPAGQSSCVPISWGSRCWHAAHPRST